MIRISFQLRGPTFVASGEQRRRDSAKRRSCCKKQCLAKHTVLGLSNIRNNSFRRLKHATAQARQGQRCSHQLQEGTALDWIVPLFRMLRVFAFDKLAKLRCVSQFLETAHIALSGRASVLMALSGENEFTNKFEVYVTVFRHS